MRPVPASIPVGTPYGQKGDLWQAGHHTGEDFLAPIGTPVVAAVGGQVVIVGPSSHYAVASAGEKYGSYGLHVVVRSTIAGVVHEQLYAHLSKASVKVGQHVDVGQRLALTGNTGHVTGSHLHFEDRVSPFTYGSDVNPRVAVNVPAPTTTATATAKPAAAKPKKRAKAVVTALNALRALRKAKPKKAAKAQAAINQIKKDYPGSSK